MDTSQVVIIVLLALTVVLIIYVMIIRGKVARTMAKESKRVHENADKVIQDRTNSLLRLVGVPFLWAIRAEMLKENNHQIDEYFNQYVKEDGIRSVILVDNIGTIKVATDKKWEGKAYKDIYQKDIEKLTDISLYDLDNDEKLMLAPITGINSRLGTVAILYHPKEV